MISKGLGTRARGPGLPKAGIETVDDYIAAQPEAAQAVLQRVRQIIRRAVPRADEVISYRIPAYKLDGRIVLFFAGWKAHYSLYPSSSRLPAALKDELRRYTVSKGTIRFPLDEPVPGTLIARIAKLRATDVAQRARATAKKR
jgi:uncharacterized protein YdhG (YjbR/CyaY superfamily)